MIKISPGLNLKIPSKIVFFPVVYCNSKYSISFSSEIFFFTNLLLINGVISELNIIPSFISEKYKGFIPKISLLKIVQSFFLS